MAGTYRNKSKLSKEEQTNLFIKLAKGLVVLRKPEEMAQFLRDLLSEPEVLMLAKRLQIAEFLVEGLTYEKIRDQAKVSFGTIARVQTWLETYGEGYRTVLSRTIKTERNIQKDSFSKLKRIYPMYYWPELLLKEIIKNANKREKERLSKVVNQLKDKTALAKELKGLLS